MAKIKAKSPEDIRRQEVKRLRSKRVETTTKNKKKLENKRIKDVKNLSRSIERIDSDILLQKSFGKSAQRLLDKKSRKLKFLKQLSA